MSGSAGSGAQVELTGSNGSGARVELTGLTKTFPGADAPVVDDVSLTVEPGTLTALLGPSGCGKTTTLRMLAGLLDPDAGDITVDGASLRRLVPERRPVSLMFQKPLLFPHLSVGENVAYGLRAQKVGRDERRHRVAEMLELVALDGFADRRVGQLSGGQEQRVSLARALVVRPQVLLLDEPLSALDAGLRVQMRALVRSVQQELRLTTVFVTHDQEEAVVLADQIGLMLAGRLVQVGPAAAFYTRPASVAVARFFGTENLLDGVVVAGTWTGPLGPVPAPGVADGPAVLVVRQESVLVDGPGPGGTAASGGAAAGGGVAAGLGDAASGVGGGGWLGSAAPGVVSEVHYVGTALRLRVVVSGAVVHAVTAPTTRLVPGDEVRLSLADGAAHVLPSTNDDRTELGEVAITGTRA